MDTSPKGKEISATEIDKETEASLTHCQYKARTPSSFNLEPFF